MSRFEKLQAEPAVPSEAPTRLRAGGWLKNAGVFFAVMLVTMLFAQGVKRAWPAGPKAYVLTATRDIAPGDRLSPANVQWRPQSGKPSPANVTSTDAAQPVENMQAVATIVAGRAIRANAVIRQAAPSPRLDKQLAGFILGEEEAGAAVRYLQPGDRVDVIAIVDSTTKKGKQVFAEPSVATVVRGAEVQALTRRDAASRFRQNKASIVIGVTEDQARVLGALRRFAALELVLSPRRLQQDEGSDPVLDWQDLAKLGLPTPVLEDGGEGGTYEAGPAAVAQAAPAGRSIEVITPNGTSVATVAN